MNSYAWELLPKLIAKIEARQKEESHKDLDALLLIMHNDSPRSLPTKKLRCAQVVSACLRSAHSCGISSEVLLNEHLELLENLSATRSWSRVKVLMHQYLRELFIKMEKLNRSPVESTIALICEDIRENLDRPRSLKDYASQAGLSVSHLSRCFSEIVGHSFRQEIWFRRSERACKLLRTTNLKISAIASMVGMKDQSQLIVKFRRHSGVTPSQYRTKSKRRL